MKTKREALMGMALAALILFTAFLPGAVFAGENVPVTIDIPITYIVNGNEDAAGGDTFTLVPDDHEAPMPEGTVDGVKSISITKEGTYSFGDIYYDKPEVYWYTVSRVLTEKKGVTKDGSVYRVEVIALNDGHGYVLVHMEGSDEKYELVYTDKVAPETGDDNDLIIYMGMAVAAAAALTVFAAAKRREKKTEYQGGRHEQ